MTANELSYNVQMRFDSLFEYAAPAYDDYQMSQILSNAQRIVTEQLVDKFEQSEHIRRVITSYSIHYTKLYDSDDQEIRELIKQLSHAAVQNGESMLLPIKILRSDSISDMAKKLEISSYNFV